MISKKLLRIFIIFDLAILAFLLLYLLLNKEKIELNDGIRAMSGRDFVELSEGFVHYEVVGPD